MACVKVCMGWNEPVTAPRSLAESSISADAAPEQWATPTPLGQSTSAATDAMASSGVVMNTTSQASATACAVGAAAHPSMRWASAAAEDWLRLATAATR